MSNPTAVLRHARENRRRQGVQPVPIRDEGTAPTQNPPHRSSHASYSALMRSHDRVHTRHISGQTGRDGA